MAEGRSLRLAVRELVVIVVGVLIALAADRWMEDIREARDEGLYLNRIAADLDLTIEDIGRTLPRIERGLEAAQALSHAEASSLPTDSIVTLHIAAGQTGVGRSQIGSDVAFRELVSSGRLNLLGDVEVRTGISEFYLDWESLVRTFENGEPLPVSVSELTGYAPYRLRGERGELSTETKAQIVAAVAERAESRSDFRRHHAQLDHQVNRLRDTLRDAEALRGILQPGG